jgi:predicted RNA binding protein YcfA (HicA-like mRNA interferase family)
MLVVLVTTTNSKQVIKKLQAQGWFLDRVKGSHHQITPMTSGHLGWGGRASRKVPRAGRKNNITVPRMVLARIDDCAKRHGQSRSGFLVDAARRAMAAQP